MRRKAVRTIRLLLIGGLALPAVSTLAARIDVSDIAGRGLAGWDEHSFQGHTDYRVVTLDGTPLISARSHASASGLYREMRVDLRETPYLNWQWRVDQPLRGLDERSKGGDDYSARVYVIRKGGLLPWRTKALNYVWSGSQPTGANWPNAYSDRARMIAVRSAADSAGRLYSERRNVQADFQRYFGAPVDAVDVIAIMTDTDNSGRQTRAYYGDLFFSR